jgi:hypothetical protein
MTRPLLFASLSLLFLAPAADAVPIRDPHDKPDAPLQLPPIALDQLAKTDVAAFGNWVVGHTPHENGLVLIHRQTRLAIYLPWASNGWINYRTPDGVSYILWSSGGSDPQGRDYDIDRILGKYAQQRVAPGMYKFQTWNVTANDAAIEFHCTAMGCRMTVRSDGTTFVHNNRVLGGPK